MLRPEANAKKINILLKNRRNKKQSTQNVKVFKRTKVLAIYLQVFDNLKNFWTIEYSQDYGLLPGL